MSSEEQPRYTSHSQVPDVLSRDDWETVKDLVFACHALDAASQKSWLDDHCPPGRIRVEVERLLAAAPASESFMTSSAPEQLLGTPPAAPSQIGRFRIERQLGAGGMGVVYAAVDERLGRHVALKILQPDATIDEERRKRLVWDARAASALNHPNIVCVYETGVADGVDYVAMELVPGPTLAESLQSESWPESRVLAVAIQIAAALEAAHARGIVHRDLKPSNVIITPAGVAKLVDFGLAKSVGAIASGNSAPPTIEGRLAGTVAYMSPEQAEGTDVDFRSDIFSFGSLLYEMLTRQRAFAGGSAVSILAKIIHTQPPVPRGRTSVLDPRLEDIVNRCHRKDRARRFQSMGEVRVRLQEIVDDPTPADAGRARPPSRAWQYAAFGAGLVALAAIAAAIAVRPRDEAPTPTSLTRLTWDGGLTTSPAVSRDGTLLAYASDRAARGDLDIWIQRMGGSDPIRLTTDAADDSAPDISPDGTKVAYRSERGGGGVYVVPSLGGTERLIAPLCRDPKYSPDGKWIACWTGDVGGAFYPKAARIWLVSAAGGPLRPFRPDFETAAFPLWMPDGGGLVFLGRKPDARGTPVIDWWVAGENGGEHATGALPTFLDLGLLPAGGSFRIRPEAWLEHPQAVLFAARHDEWSSTNVWSVGMNPRGELQGPPRPATFGAGVEERPTVPARASSAAAPSLIFASLAVDFQLRRMPLSSKQGDRSPQPLLPNISQIASPSLSADGRLLVFSGRQQNGYRVVAIDTATAGEHLVTTVESPEFVRVIVSGDGKSVVYGGGGHVGYRMPINQGPPESICSNCGWPTHVNYDGSEALFESITADERLLIWSGGSLRPLIGSADPKNRMQYAGRFSPDKRWVAFCAVTRDSGAREIVIVPNAPHRTLREDEWISISEGQTSDREPYWSPDGRRLFFISDRDGFRCIWARDVDPQTGKPAGSPVSIAHFHHARELLRSPRPASGSIGLTATADTLVFTVEQSTGNLWWQHGAGR
jgi:Tol biopolymer transport system component